MIPRQYRLNLSKERVYGRPRHGLYFFIIKEQSSSVRFAMKVSRKIDRRSVVRNRLRRQVMMWLYENRDSLAGWKVLVGVKRKIGSDDVKAAFVELKTLLKP